MSLPDSPHRRQTLPGDVAASLARAADRLGAMGRDVHWYAEASSTNDVAAALAESGAAEGTTVIADAQTAGRGRRGRAWHSPAGSGLYVSLVLRPQPAVVPLLTLAAGVALVEGIRAATGFTAVLKWPNDVMAPASRGSGAKLAGILVEGLSRGGADIRACVVGFGVNLRPAAYPPEVAARATSLERELGRAVERGPLLAHCLEAFAARYDDLHAGRRPDVVAAWRSLADPLLGRPVEWDAPDGVHRGVAQDVDASGALLVRTSDGAARVIAGEVRWI